MNLIVSKIKKKHRLSRVECIEACLYIKNRYDELSKINPIGYEAECKKQIANEIGKCKYYIYIAFRRFDHLLSKGYFEYNDNLNKYQHKLR